MPTPAETRLAATYGATGSRLRGQVVSALVKLWRSQPAYREQQAETFPPLAARIVYGGQQQTSSLMTAYLAQQKALLLGRGSTPARVPIQRVAGRATRNLDPVDVYRRPIVEVWRQLAADVPFTEAVKRGEERLVKIAETDLQVTKTRTAEAALGDDQDVVGYRRVLVGPENCGLCVIASTVLYSRDQLMPIHPACDCGISAVYDEADFDEDGLLRQAHAAVKREFGQSAADGRRVDYRKLILTRENSETGPMLTVASHRFTDLTDLRRR